MPYKYPKGKGWDIPKQKYGVTKALLHSSKSDQFWRFAYPAATLTSN
ncbi:hypothetical protein KU39_3p6 (plasmid) [Piscirickettsia salmonis]|uniref:Uncharacterized protein n=1 Tax=Piscirickettsia salmonis TaxID=1238 RepID=A0AAC9EVG1_PISSA|nr:hypothetical protein [Piscirickettsia salmonis]ALB24468.1 hypothetical protein KU39_3p6 [Piscirickettsia salmonis]